MTVAGLVKITDRLWVRPSSVDGVLSGLSDACSLIVRGHFVGVPDLGADEVLSLLDAGE